MNPRTPKHLPVVAVNFLYEGSHLALGGCSLAVYLVCSAIASSPRKWCRFELTPAQLVTATGYSLNSVKTAIKKLQAEGYIIPFGEIFELGSPRDSLGYKHPLVAGKKQSLRAVLFHNRIPYLQLPEELLQQLPRMSAVELQATVVMLELTSYPRSLETTATEWARAANITNTRDLYAVTENMTWCCEIEQTGRNFYVRRTDRDTREERLDKAMERQSAKNHAPERPYTTTILLEWLESLGVRSLPGCSNSDLQIFCPACMGIKPSLSIDITQGPYGIFYCHNCRFGKRMIVLHLLDKLNIPKKIYMGKLKEIAARHEHGERNTDDHLRP